MRLTINSGLQWYAQNVLAQKIKEVKAASGTVVVQSVKTGELLAIASYPTFDPNQITDTSSLTNLAFTEVFEPGSTAKVITATDSANQISEVEDLISNKSAKSVVILPYDNTLESTLKKLADSKIPFVMFDRVIDSVSSSAVSCVKGDNEGIGKETATRFIQKDGLKPGDKILIMPGDNSSVPELRNKGFKDTLLANGWTQAQVDAIESTDYTGWSRSKGKQLFIDWLNAHTTDEIAQYHYIFTHDDEIGMGILEALKSSDIDSAKKDAFLKAGVNLASSSGLNEMYSVLKGTHQKDYTQEVSSLKDLFTVTYDPAMIQTAVQDMVDSFDGKTVTQNHVISVSVVDTTNVGNFTGFGDAVAK